MAAKKQKKASKHELLQQFMGGLNNADRKVIAFAGDVKKPYTLRRPSGIMQLDIDHGGGLPAGGLSYISGPDNAGKTYLLYKYFAMHQKLYGDDACLAYLDVEGAFDHMSAMMAGVKLEIPDSTIEEWDVTRALRGLPPFTKEERASFKEKVGELVIIQEDSGDEYLNRLLECIESKLFGIIAVDSVSMLLPSVDAGKEVGENDKQASLANIITQFFRRYGPHTNTLNALNYSTVIFTSQVRANRKKSEAQAHMQKYLKDWAPTGAHSARHGKKIDTVLSSGEKIRKKTKAGNFVIGKMLKWEIIKGTLGTHDNITGEAPFIYPNFGGTGVDTTESIITTGLQRGVIFEDVGTGEVYLRTPKAEEGKIFISPNMKVLPGIIDADFDFELEVRREILSAAGIDKCRYR